VRADHVRAEMQAVYSAVSLEQPEPVPFGEALRAVLAGPHEVAQAPKQS